ncbi:MAG: hypothetical protein ACXVCI_07385, partial [Bdellovibrionota bacterium]
RLAALNSLKTYKRSENYDNVAQRVIAALKLEIANSTDALRKESARTLLASFIDKAAAAK